MGFLATAHVVLFIVVVMTVNSEDLYGWSHRVNTNEAYNLSCSQDDTNLTTTSVLYWTRHGSDLPIANDNQFQLLPNIDGVNNAILQINNVTDDLRGYYLCHVKDSPSSEGHVVLQGINIGPIPVYRDNIDKYRADIIRGVIAAACVAFAVISIGMISKFRYLSEEQKQKRKQRKEGYQTRPHIQGIINGGASS